MLCRIKNLRRRAGIRFTSSRAKTETSLDVYMARDVPRRDGEGDDSWIMSLATFAAESRRPTVYILRFRYRHSIVFRQTPPPIPCSDITQNGY